MATWHLLWLLCSCRAYGMFHMDTLGGGGGGECCPVELWQFLWLNSFELEFFIWYFIWGGNWGQWDILLSPADTA